MHEQAPPSTSNNGVGADERVEHPAVRSFGGWHRPTLAARTDARAFLLLYPRSGFTFALPAGREAPMDREGSSARLQTRRSWLTGAAAAVAGFVVASIGKVGEANAADGDALQLGEPNTSSSQTSLDGSAPGTSDSVLKVTGAGTSGTAIEGIAGGIGFHGTGSHGVVGSSTSVNGVGVLGEDLTQQSIGRGVQGLANNGWGVYAVSQAGQALRVDGRATFKRAGTVQITYPAKKATVPVPGAISTQTSFPERFTTAMAMLQSNVPGVFVRAAVLDQSAGTLTIYLNRPPGTSGSPRSATAAWFLVN